MRRRHRKAGYAPTRTYGRIAGREAQITLAYLRGASSAALAAEYGVVQRTVQAALRRSGISRANRRQQPEHPEHAILRAYGVSPRKIRAMDKRLAQYAERAYD